MQAYIEFETKIREQLFEEQKISFSIIDETDMDEAERLKIILMAQGGEDGPGEDEPGLKLLKTVEELRGFIDQGYTIENFSAGRYEEFFLPEVDKAPEEIKNYFLENNKITLETISKVIPTLSDDFIESLLKVKSISFFDKNDISDNLAKSLKPRDTGAKLMNIFFQKEDNRIEEITQREIIFKYFVDKIDMFENILIKGYLKDKDKSIFINDNTFTIIPIHVDLNVVVNKNYEMKFSSQLLARHLLTVSEQAKSCAGIKEVDFFAKVKDDEIASVKLCFNLEKKSVLNKSNLEKFIEDYLKFITSIQHITEEEEIVGKIHAWIPSHLRAIELELTLRDKTLISKTSKI